MADFQLSEVDDEDLNLDLIPRIEKSFGFRFGESDLAQVTTFGEFCDVVLAKFPVTETTDCTSQQAFYKLRRLLALHIPGAAIMPSTSLTALLPRNRTSRKQILHAVETELGFPLAIIGMSAQAELFIFLAFLASLAAFFVSWQAGIIGLSLSTIMVDIASKLSNTIQGNTLTIKDVVKKMTRQHYTQSRRNSFTVNRNEIVHQVKELFCYELSLKASALTRDARF